MTSEVNRLLAELPASVHALTGVDLSKVCASPAVAGLPGQPTGLTQALRLWAPEPQPHGSPILADTPDQEGHRCTGVRLPEAHTPQQPPASPFSTGFNTTWTTGTLLTLVPYFVGTRSAACSGLLWLSSLLSCLCLLPFLILYPTPLLSLPRLPGLSLLPSSSCTRLFLCLSFSLLLFSHTPSTFIM